MGFFHRSEHHIYFVKYRDDNKVCKSNETVNASEETREQKKLRKKHHHHVLFKALVLPPAMAVVAAGGPLSYIIAEKLQQRAEIRDIERWQLRER